MTLNLAPTPDQINAWLVGAGSIAAAAAPAIWQAFKWRSEAKARALAEEKLRAENAKLVAEKEKLEKEGKSTEAQATRTIVNSAGDLLAAALAGQVQANAERAQLLAQQEELRRKIIEVEASGERIIKDLRQDNANALKNQKAEHEAEYQAMARQISDLSVSYSDLKRDYDTLKRDHETLQANYRNEQERSSGLAGRLAKLEGKE